VIQTNTGIFYHSEVIEGANMMISTDLITTFTLLN